MTLSAGVALLERAISYTLGSLQLVTPEALSRPTPCAAWDLRQLLTHMSDSLDALHEAVGGRIALVPPTAGLHPADDPATALVAGLKSRACSLLGEWSAVDGDGGDTAVIGGFALTSRIVTTAGALEVTVHGWDVAQACGRRRAITPGLAEELLAYAPVLVTPGDRPTRFAAPFPLRTGEPGDRLLALLGRDPR